MKEYKKPAGQTENISFLLMMIVVGAWGCFQFGPSLSQVMLPFLKVVATLAIFSMLWSLALGFRAEKSGARMAERAIAPLLGLAALAVVVGLLLGKVNQFFGNFQNLLSL